MAMVHVSTETVEAPAYTTRSVWVPTRYGGHYAERSTKQPSLSVFRGVARSPPRRTGTRPPTSAVGAIADRTGSFHR